MGDQAAGAPDDAPKGPSGFALVQRAGEEHQGLHPRIRHAPPRRSHSACRAAHQDGALAS
eukprot:1772007-Prymnesium_polylepis.1